MYCEQESYVSQINATDNANYRLLLSYTGDNAQERASVKKSSKFIANPSTGSIEISGTVNAKHFISDSGGILLYSGSFNDTTASISIADLFTAYQAVQICITYTINDKMYWGTDIIPIGALLMPSTMYFLKLNAATTTIAQGTNQVYIQTTRNNDGLKFNGAYHSNAPVTINNIEIYGII